MARPPGGGAGGPVAVTGTFNEGFGNGTFVGTYDPATGAFQGTFTDPDGTFTVSVDPVTGVVTEVEDGEVTTYSSLAEFQSDGAFLSFQTDQGVDLAGALDLTVLEVNPETGALEGTFTDAEGTFTISVDPVTGVVTDTENGVTVVYEGMEDFLNDDGGEGGDGFDFDVDVEVDTPDVGFEGID